jgi:aspartyl-tRNA synthetase
MTLQRTHNIEQIIHAEIGIPATLMGWVHHRRDFGQLIFITLRDRFGELQCVFDPELNPAGHAVAEGLRGEYVVAFTGACRARPEKERREYPGGDREFVVESAMLLNAAEPLPFSVEEDVKASEELRLKHRYIDLRRRTMVQALTIRHKAIAATRNYLNAQGFLEVETPLLARSTPEGARDYVVPSRVHPGTFFALPQSPQLFKQILMVAGLDRYYQIAKCLRDEDLRGNRQPEHTQLDLEMSFATRDDLFHIAEGCMAAVWHECLGHELPRPFPRLTFTEAMARFGSDKPDMRFGSEIVDLTELAWGIEANFVQESLNAGNKVLGVFIPGASLSRKQLDQWTEAAKGLGAGGLMTLELSGEDPKGTVAKFVKDAIGFAAMAEKSSGTHASTSTGTWFMVAGDYQASLKVLGQLRLQLAAEFGLIDSSRFAFLWVVDFPLYSRGENGEVESGHNPFSVPLEEDLHKLESEDPEVLLTIRADNYDLVLNGVEMSSGSLRINKPEMQRAVFRRMGMSDETIDEQFGWFIDAYRYGAPPHRGFGQGMDRVVMSLIGTENIRDVIAFPKTATAQDPLTGAPSKITEQQWKELGLKQV